MGCESEMKFEVRAFGFVYLSLEQRRFAVDGCDDLDKVGGDALRGEILSFELGYVDVRFWLAKGTLRGREMWEEEQSMTT